MQIETLPLPLSVIIAEVEVDPNQLVEGDIILLKKSVDQPIGLYLQDQLVMRGFIGIKESKKAFFIKEVL